MWKNHKKAIEILRDKFKGNDAFTAMIISGSIARGRAKESSDVDIVLVASEAEYERRAQKKQLHYLTRDVEHKGGVVDGKVVDKSFLREAADRGSEPTRAAFIDSYCLYSHDDEIQDLIRRIPVYQESEREEKMKSFWAQLHSANWYYKQAGKRDDPYLRMFSVNKMVLFAGRLILAHNRILYPYHKWFLKTLETAPERPDGLTELMTQAMDGYHEENVQRLFDAVITYKDWIKPPEGWAVRYNQDSEYNWLNHPAPLEDR